MSIKAKNYHVDDTTSGGIHIVYDAVYYGSGELDTNTYTLIIKYTEEQIFKDSIVVFQWISTAIKDSI